MRRECEAVSVELLCIRRPAKAGTRTPRRIGRARTQTPWQQRRRVDYGSAAFAGTTSSGSRQTPRQALPSHSTQDSYSIRRELASTRQLPKTPAGRKRLGMLRSKLTNQAAQDRGTQGGDFCQFATMTGSRISAAAHRTRWRSSTSPAGDASPTRNSTPAFPGSPRICARALGIKRGDRVAVLALNTTDTLEVQFACGRHRRGVPAAEHPPHRSRTALHRRRRRARR